MLEMFFFFFKVIFIQTFYRQVNINSYLGSNKMRYKHYRYSIIKKNKFKWSKKDIKHFAIKLFVHMYVCVYVVVCVCVRVHVCIYLCLCMCLCLYVCMHAEDYKS